MYNREYTPERITELKPNEIFVFGSNLAGAHGGGAARLAYNRFGAIWGQGVGLQGQSYAIPTMQGGVETIKPYVDEFISFARTRPDLKFYVTQIGCGIAGFKAEEIAPLFQTAIDVENIILPQAFVEFLSKTRYPKIEKLINNVDIANYPAYKECVKGVAEITALDEYNIPFIWKKMLSAVLRSCNIKVKYDTKQAVSNWIEAAFMWNASVYAPLAKEGYFPFPVSGEYYDFGFSRELGYLDGVVNPYLRRYILAIALFEILRYYVKEEKPKPLYDVWKGLVKTEICFDERDMWGVIGNWPVQIDWNYYDLQFDGKNFAFLANNQSRLNEYVFPIKPIHNSYMVMDRVYAGEYPRDIDDKKSIEKIEHFSRFGITHFIDLTEEGELRPYQQMLATQMQHIRFPIQDVSIPANIESVKDLIGQIHGILNESDRNKVYIHCWGGVGRTGTIVGCLLSHRHDFDYEKTMDSLKKAFSDCPKSAYRETPETKEQRDFIARYAAEMKQEELGRQALLMWKMGAGNSAKRFNMENPIPQKTKVATKDSWNIEPMPEKHTTIPMDESIPSAAMHIVKYGHIPDAMEDHWFMYCDETTIRYYRSWTGFCIYVAKYEDDGKTCRITDLTVNREPEQYSCTDDKHDVALFMALLTEEYGGDASEYWQKAF